MSGQAWAEYCDRLKAMGQRILQDDFPGAPRDRAEGFRHLARMAAMGIGWGIEVNDADFPAFYRHQGDSAKWGGPNVDNFYLRARLRGDATYRIRGDVGSIQDLIIAPADGDMHEEKYGVLADLDLSQLEVGPDGRLELTLSPEPAPAGQKNWIQLNPRIRHVEIRQYLYDWERHQPGHFEIVRVGSEGQAPPPLEPARMARLLDAAADWVETSVVYWKEYMARSRAALAPNSFGPARHVPGGSSDILYGDGRFDLEPDQAMIIEVTRPKARYWSFQWYSWGWFESPDFAHRLTSLNGQQARVDSDGKVRIVVAHRDPGVPNWLDTEGRREAMFIYRYVWSDDAPLPVARVVPFAELRKHLPPDTPSVDAQARRAQLEARRAQVHRLLRH
jgi:hypothetical protein